MQWLSVKIPNLMPLVILNVYMPPQGNVKTACKIINESIANAGLKGNAEIYLMGDFNINLSDRSLPASKELLFTTGINSLTPKISIPTRFSVRDGLMNNTCIDRIFTNSAQILESKTLDTHSRRDLFRVFDIGFGQVEDILGIILAKEFFKKSN